MGNIPNNGYGLTFTGYLYLNETINSKEMFVTINYISCSTSYMERLEYLMQTRKKEIDNMPGFIEMEVLKPNGGDNVYLIISHWEDKSYFDNWRKSEAFAKGHRRGFEDIEKARKEGNEQPIKSTFKTYEILTR